MYLVPFLPHEVADPNKWIVWNTGLASESFHMIAII